MGNRHVGREAMGGLRGQALLMVICANIETQFLDPGHAPGSDLDM